MVESGLDWCGYGYGQVLGSSEHIQVLQNEGEWPPNGF